MTNAPGGSGPVRRALADVAPHEPVSAGASCCKPVPPGYSEEVGTRRHLFAALIVALVVLVVVVAVTPWDAPRPRSAAAPAGEFSSARAMDVLRVVAAEPRPIGSPRSAAVRDFIYGRLKELALNPHVQTSEVVSAREPRVAGVVHNVVARLPGRDPSRAVLLVAHYDSVPTAAGAADDGSGVAALLETARALRSGPSPRNDIIFLFTDGEERGLLGSQAFLRDEPWAYAAGVVLNFDSPGSSSPALMYETSPGNGLLISHYLAAGRAYGSSLMYEVSRRQPVVSDFRPFVARGIPGMTFGMLDGPAVDHTAYDSVARFSEAGLQHEGDTALALARRLGDADLWQLHAPDVVYFDVVGSVAVSYPRSYVTPFLALAVALFVVAVAIAARRRLLTLRGAAWASPRHRRHPGRVALRRRHRLDDVPHRLRGARLDGHRRRHQRLVPARPRPARVGGRAGHLRGRCCAACAPGTSPSSRWRGGPPGRWA